MLICVACATPMFKAIKKAGNREKEGSKLLNENLKFFRKKKGLTQEDLANSLNVVRQTVSKWEKGISVPDAEMLMRIADLLGASVSELMGGTIKDEKNENTIAQELSRINEQMANKNRRSKKITRIIIAILGLLLAWYIVLCFLNFAPI